MTSPALWLAVRELAARRKRVALAAGVVAATAAAITATELLGRAREEAVARQMDAIGPALTVVPSGTSAGALARYELDGVLPPATEALVREALGRDLRAVERRRVLQREIDGALRPVVAVERGASAGAAEVGVEGAVGSELARHLAGRDSVPLDGRPLRIARVLPSTGSVEDLAFFVSLDVVRDGVNELRLFLRPGVSPHDAEARLARASLGATVLRNDRGDVADRETQESLARHRRVAYVVMAGVVALCLLIAAHLDAAERRVELATLVAIGASRSTILGGLLARSAVVAGVGAAVGTVAGAVLAAGHLAVAEGVRGWALAATIIAAGVCVGVVAAAPTAITAVTRDPVRELQEE